MSHRVPIRSAGIATPVGVVGASFGAENYKPAPQAFDTDWLASTLQRLKLVRERTVIQFGSLGGNASDACVK